MSTPYDRLHAEFVEALHSRTGLLPALVAPYVDALMEHLQEQYSTTFLYVPARRRSYPFADMRRDLLAGEPYPSVAKRYAINRRTLYRMLPKSQLFPTSKAARQ